MEPLVDPLSSYRALLMDLDLSNTIILGLLSEMLWSQD